MVTMITGPSGDYRSDTQALPGCPSLLDQTGRRNRSMRTGKRCLLSLLLLLGASAAGGCTACYEWRYPPALEVVEQLASSVQAHDSIAMLRCGKAVIYPMASLAERISPGFLGSVRTRSNLESIRRLDSASLQLTYSVRFEGRAETTSFFVRQNGDRWLVEGFRPPGNM